MTVQEWIDGYIRAWEDRDADAAAELFTEDAEYRDDPFSGPHTGREGVRSYWSGVTESQSDVHVRFGAPIVAADRAHAAAEFWVNMLNGGAEVTLTGIVYLRFGDGGLCEELRETWNFAAGRIDPPAGWGR
ncbi:MAG TPA: nuclear transport factor 2 family protein [Solirubrobacteraceae bacterium]|jgi:hypothetical protein